MKNATSEQSMLQLTNTTKQSPSLETGASWASQEIPWILYSQRIHDRVHNSLPLVAILGQINPVHTPSHTTGISLTAILILFSIYAYVF